MAAANANGPKGTIDDDGRRFQIYTNDQSIKAADYAPLIIAYRNGAAVRLSDIAQVTDSVEDVRNLGLSNGQPAVLVILFSQPGTNIVATIDSVRASCRISKPLCRPTSKWPSPSTAARRSVNLCTTPS